MEVTTDDAYELVRRLADRNNEQAPTELLWYVVVLAKSLPDSLEHVLVDSQSKDGTTEWRVFALAGSRMVHVSATADHPDWDADSGEVDARVTCWARSSSDVERIAVTDVTTERSIVRGDRTQVVSAWELHVRDEAPVTLPLFGGRPHVKERDTIEEIVRALMTKPS